MNLLKLPLTFLLTISLLTVPVAAQHKHRTAEKSPAKPPAAPVPSPSPSPTPESVTPVTFDTLLAADSYKIYAEARGVGQLIGSSAVNDVLEPILQLGGPDKDFVTFVNWLKAHAEQLTTSRLLVASWATFKDIPDAVI